MDQLDPVAPQDILVTLLGNELLHRPDARVSAAGLVEVLGAFGVGTAAARAAIARLVRRDLLERHREGRTAAYSLTPRAVTALTDGERRIVGFAEPPSAPGNTWTLLGYSLPKERRAERDRLRRRLAFLGFGSPRDGSWIGFGDRSADVAAALEQTQLTDDVDVFVGTPAPSTHLSRLVSSAWPQLGTLGDAYRSFADRWASTRITDPVIGRVQVMHEWRQFPLADPGLPDDHLTWAADRRAAAAAFRTTWDQLRPAAAAGFAERCAASAATSPAPNRAGAHA